MRVAKYSGFYILFCALLLPLGYSVEQMPFASVLIGISSAELAASLPVSGIAGFGAYEGAWALTFEMLGFPKEIASLSAISHHLFTQVYGYLLGMIGLLILLSPLLRFSQGIPLKFPGNFLVRTFASALTIALLFTPLLRADSRHKDSQSIDLTNTLLNIPEDLNGQIVFDSNASGSFDIFAFSTSERRLRPLISTEAHEMYPDVYFKDGEMLLVYARTLSLMRSAPSDIWLYSAKSGSSKKIISDGTFPSFSSDGLKVYFERGRRQLVEFNLRSGIETEIIPGKYENWKKWKIVKPQVSADGKMVAFISDRPSRWHSWVVNLETGAETLIGEGCEPAWRDEQSLYFIQKQGAQAGSGIWTFNLLDKTKQPFLDFADPLGHEYFPRALSKNSVLYAAANADEHSHTGATYEIFWGKNGKRQQITQLAATSRWPKYLASQTPDATIK